MAKTIQVTPDIAAIYVKYIKKNCKPNPNDMFDLLDIEGNVVKMLYSNILHIAKQSQHEHNKREIEGLTISAEMQLSEIKDRANEILEAIEPMAYQIERVKEIANKIIFKVDKPKGTIRDMYRNKIVSVRVYHALKHLEVTNLEGVQNFTEEDIIKLRNTGKKTLKELKDLMNKYNIHFKAI